MTTGEIVLALTILTGLVWIAAVAAIAIGLGRLKSSPGDACPTVAVLVPARNEEQNIGRCLEALAGQDYPPELREIIIIDDHSQDRTAEIASDYLDRIPGLRIHEAGDPPPGVAPMKSAIASLIRDLTAEVILTTDADCTPPPGWMTGVARHFQQDVDAVVGFSPLHGSGLAGVIARFDSFINFVVAAGSIGLGKVTTAAGRNLAYRRAMWQNVGGFGPTITGASGVDDLLLQRMSMRGGKVVFSTDPATFVPAKGPSSVGNWLSRKRRHLSAGRHYRPGLVALSAGLYLFNLGLILSTVLAASGEVNWLPAAALWAAKLIIDGLTLSRGARILRVRGWTGAWLVGELISPLLFTLLLPASLVGRVRWKGRTLKG